MNSDSILVAYKKFLEDLARNNSTDLFTNGGKEYASILMSVLYHFTQNEVRLFCSGFGPSLIKTEPYWSALIDFLNDKNKTLKVLVETDEYKNGEPMTHLKKVKETRENKGSIIVKQISNEDKKLISEKVGSEHCNFAVFDDNKFRFEHAPEDYKAYGSFNRPVECAFLMNVFDAAFNNSQKVLV